MNPSEELHADIVVLGGGVAGAAAALAARRAGCDVLLLEKATLLGGLASLGIINFFVPMDNGAGRLATRGMAEEFLRLSARNSFDTLPGVWKQGEPDPPVAVPCTSSFSPQIFALELLNLLHSTGVRLRFDTAFAGLQCDAQRRVRAVNALSPAGITRIHGRVFIDGTGSAALFAAAGAPCRTGVNYYSYFGRVISLASCARAVASGRICDAYEGCSGGAAGLDGSGHPQGMQTYDGTNAEDVTDFLIRNQLELYGKLCRTDRWTREVVTLPTIPQLRTVRCLLGDAPLQEADVGRTRPDSIGVISDFEHTGDLYEVPYGVLVRHGFPNLLAVGRGASALGRAWDILRVIPPAILTGQAAGNAAALALAQPGPASLPDLPLAPLQDRLAAQGVLLHITPELRRRISAGAPQPKARLFQE